MNATTKQPSNPMNVSIRFDATHVLRGFDAAKQTPVMELVALTYTVEPSEYVVRSWELLELVRSDKTLPADVVAEVERAEGFGFRAAGHPGCWIIKEHCIDE